MALYQNSSKESDAGTAKEETGASRERWLLKQGLAPEGIMPKALPGGQGCGLGVLMGTLVLLPRSQQAETDLTESVPRGDPAELQEVPTDGILLDLVLMQCVVDLKLRVENLNVTMVPVAAGAGQKLSPPLLLESKEDQEERVLAMLGIVGTILNLLVIIFVYIYTTI
ncbi:uncharacterized protein PHA67_002730 isoform 1-T1 [Liasis olivaceus]